MNEITLSRRTMLAAGLTATGLYSAQSLTAGVVIQRIKDNIGVPWRQTTVDNIIAGSADLPVQGIATTMMATLDVLMRASKAGRNMVITHESTFFSHQDTVDQLGKDETYRFKLDFLQRNGMTVFHFHDHWHARKPDGIATGMNLALGWEKNVDPTDPRTLNFPGIPLVEFVKDIQNKLGIRTMRVVGDPKLLIRRAATSWGYVSQFPGIPVIARENIDVLIVGETREWELVEYVQDMISSGKKKALILLGHVVSEQSGMKHCADWLRPLVPEVPVEFIAAPEPFWSPST